MKKIYILNIVMYVLMLGNASACGCGLSNNGGDPDLYTKNNVFYKMIHGEIPCKKIYEDKDVLAFHDDHPLAKVHVLVVPKREYRSFNSFVAKAKPKEIAHFMKVIQKIAKDLGLDKTGYRLITNHGRDADQEVPHFHVHLLGGNHLGYMGKCKENAPQPINPGAITSIENDEILEL